MFIRSATHGEGTNTRGIRRPGALAVACAHALFCFQPGAAAEAPQEVLLDACESAAGWDLDSGREFPGAAGTIGAELRDGRACLRVDFDFRRGGNYLGASREGEIPESSEIRFFALLSGASRGMVRLRDATGQEFLGGFHASGDGWARIALPLTAEAFARHWGGANDGRMHWPLRRLLIAATAPGCGALLLRDVTILTSAAAPRWQVSIAAPEPGHIAFADEPPPVVTVAARNCAQAPVDAEMRCVVTRDDGRQAAATTSQGPFARWERRECAVPLPSSEPGHYRVSAEIASGTSILARAEGGIGIVHRPLRLGADDPDSFFGLHVNEPAAAARIGVKWTRVFRQWWWVESLKGRWWWPDESTVDAARVHHMRIMLTLDAGPPAWAKKEFVREGDPVLPFSDALLAAYGRFIREAARHYRDTVDVFEIQNEPDLTCWRHENLPFEAGIEAFARLAGTAAPAIREEAPGKPLAGIDVSGGDYDSGLQFSRAALRRVGGLFEIFTGHPYASPRYFGEGLRPLLPHENRETEKLRESQGMIAALGGKQRVWVGEKGWGLDVREPSHGPNSFAYADCAAQALVTARAVAGVERCFWFLQQGANEGGYEYGLWRGSPSQPLPAAIAYATTAHHLDHAAPRWTLHLPQGLAGFGFEGKEPARSVAVLWSNDEACDLPAAWPEGTRACGLMGRACGLAPLRVTRSPVFLTAPAAQLGALRDALERQPPIPVEPVRIENIRLVSTRRLVARILNRQQRPVALSPRVGGITAPAQTIEPGQTREVAFELAESVRRLGWKTVPADFLDDGRLIASNPLALNLRRCPSRAIKLVESTASLGKPSTKVADRWQVLPPDPTAGWSGPNDLSAEVWWACDTNCFYFAAQVTDDVHVAKSANAADAWDDDSLALAFDGDNDGGDAPGYGPDDTEIICVAAAAGPRAFLTHPDARPIEIECSTQRSGTTTSYQLAIPWRILRMTPSPGRIFAFNFTLNDNDGSGRAYWMGPRPGIVQAKHPGQFMDLFLDEP